MSGRDLRACTAVIVFSKRFLWDVNKTETVESMEFPFPLKKQDKQASMVLPSFDISIFTGKINVSHKLCLMT